MATPSPDVLAQLLGPSWRGIPFPLVRLHNGGSNDLVEHKRPDQDGFHVEATGANNLVFAATIPFRNGVLAGPSELWNGRTLYPDVFRAFLLACADKSTGELIHPELGQINVKCRRFDWEYDANRRDGCDFDVEWIQSLDEGEFIGSISEPSPVSAAVALATQLDSDVAALSPPPPELVPYTASFSDMMRSLQAIPDTAALLSKQIGGVFHKIAAKIDALEDAMVRLNNVRYWPIVEGLEHLRSSIFDLEKTFGKDHKVIREYVVMRRTTLATLARLLGQKIDDLIRLNPLLVEDLNVPAGARVKFYITKG